MKKASLRKSIATAILLLVLAFSATTINTPLVKADAGGIGKRLTIEIVGEGSVTAKRSRAGVTFYFYPELGYHVSAIKIESETVSDFIVPAPSYTFTLFKDVKEDWKIVVFFSADGEAYIPAVPAVTNIPVDLGGGVSFYLYSTKGGGTATQEDLLLDLAKIDPELALTSLILLEVSIPVSFDTVKIALPYSGDEIEHMYWGDVDLLYSDVTGDGVVNGDDVSDVANAIKSYTGHGEYNANCDVDRDGKNDEDDIHLVNEYKGTSLQEIDKENFWVDEVNHILYIETELNRVFRGR